MSQKSIATGISFTNPIHSGKVCCYTCSKFIEEGTPWVFFELVYFHEDCYNGYEHYYGLDKPID